MSNKEYKQLRINYKVEERVGKMLDRIREAAEFGKLSCEIRDLLWITKGGEYLRNVDAPGEEIKQHLLQSLKYYAGQIEETRMLLELEHRASKESSIDVNPRIEEVEEKIQDCPIARKNSIAKSLSI